MDFRKTDEQELLLGSIREFFQQNVTEQKVQQWIQEGKPPFELMKAYIDAGFGLLGLPEKFGGTPVDHLTLVMVFEEVYKQAGFSMPWVLNNINMFNILEFGSPEQIEICMDIYKQTGIHSFAMAISEPGAGSDNSVMSTTAKKIDGKFVINGSKVWVTDGEYTPYFLVFAKDEDSSPQNKSISAWLIPRDTPGITITPIEKIVHTFMPFSQIDFTNVVIDENCRVGEQGKGFFNLMKNLEVERLYTCAHNLGFAQAAMEDSAAYTSQRVQFGQPIGNFEIIQEKLTEMETKLVTARDLIYRTAWEYDNGISVRILSPLTKRYVARVTTEVCSEALQIYGALGYTTGTRVGRLWQECRGCQLAGGTDEIMAYIAGRQIVKKYRKK